MSEWRWVGRAVVFGMGIVAVCGGLGEWFGLASAPLKGGMILVVFLGGGGLAINWVGGTGVWAVAIGLLTMMGLGFEGGQTRFVKSVRFVEAQDVWPDGARGVRFAEPLLHRDEWRGTERWSQTFNHRTESRTTTVVPLVAKAGGPVVAFDCYGGVRDASRDGRWAVQVPADCDGAIRLSKEKLTAAKQVLAPGADVRVVNVYTSREAFEATGDVALVYRMTGVFLFIYLVGVVLYRERGVSGRT